MNTPKNILVFNPSFLGDSVLTTPLVNALRKRYPSADISLCVRPEFAGLFTGLTELKEVIPFQKRGAMKGVRGIFRFGKLLKEKQFDLIITAHKSIRSTMVVTLSGAPRRIGFAQAAMGLLHTDTVNRNMALHEVERNLMLLQPLDSAFNLKQAKEDAGIPHTYLNTELHTKAEQFLRTAAGNGKLIGFNPGSVWKTKRWLTDRFVAVAEKLVQDGHTIVLFGGPGDAEETDLFKKLATFPYVNFAGRTSLAELPTYINICDLLITNDSGPLHIAVSQNTPAVAIFGPTVKALGFFPYDTVSKVVEVHGLSCRPCGLHGGNVCPKKHFRCMEEITADAVYSVVKKALEQQS